MGSAFALLKAHRGHIKTMQHDDLTPAHEWANALEAEGLQEAADAVREACEVQQ